MNHYDYSDYNDWRHDAIGHYSEIIAEHRGLACLAMTGIVEPLETALYAEGEEYFADSLDAARVRDIMSGDWDYTLEALFDRIGGEVSLRDDAIAWAA